MTKILYFNVNKFEFMIWLRLLHILYKSQDLLTPGVSQKTYTKSQPLNSINHYTWCQRILTHYTRFIPILIAL